jgi:hypothetical protein
MVEKVKFVSVTRTIDTRNGPLHGIHYLDAIDTEGQHWMAEMRSDVEKWLVFTRVWYKDAQVPYD